MFQTLARNLLTILIDNYNATNDTKARCVLDGAAKRHTISPDNARQKQIQIRSYQAAYNALLSLRPYASIVDNVAILRDTDYPLYPRHYPQLIVSCDGDDLHIDGLVDDGGTIVFTSLDQHVIID